MKLLRLNLARFRSYFGITLDLTAPRVLIAGLNGSGKTSIREAVRWSLTGRCDGTDGKGAGAEVLVPTGSKDALVVATLDKIGQVERTYGLTGGGSLVIENVTGTSQIQQQALYIKLDTTPAFVDAVLETESFLRLNHIDGKALVLSLLGVKFEVDGSIYSLDQLDAKYRQAFEDRKAAKKAFQNVTVPDPPANAQMPSEEKITTQLGLLRKELGDKRQAVGMVTGKRQALTSETDRLAGVKTEGEDLTAQIDSLTAKVTALEAEVVPAPVSQPAPAKGDPARLTFLRSTVTLLQHDPSAGCVLDRTVPCLTSKTAFLDRLNDLKTELKALDPKPVEPVQGGKTAASPLTVARTALADLTWRQQQFEASVTKAREADVRLEQIRSEMASLPDTSTQDAEIVALEGRIQKGEQLLKDARFHWAASAVYKIAVENRKDAEREVARLEDLVEQLGPKGIRVKTLEDAIGKFQAAVNPYIQKFGWSVEFSVDPWEAIVNHRPVETYSRSEQYRIAIALQIGIAQLSGLNFACIDETDMLDVVNRGIVTKMLLDAPLEQIIIMGTRELSQPLPNIAGVKAFRLGTVDGRSEILEQVGP